jgi:hypothetical protein
VPGGLTRDDFRIDYAAGTVTCPNNHTVTISAKGNASFGHRCNSCPLRTRCTTNKAGRSLHISEHDQLLAAARAQAKPHSSPRAISAGRWSNGRSPGSSTTGISVAATAVCNATGCG